MTSTPAAAEKQLRNPDRHGEVEAEERDLGGIFVDEDNDLQQRESPAAPVLALAHVSAIRVSALCRPPDRTVQLFRLPRS